MIYKNKKEVVRFARGLGSRTNNEAEYEALIAALLICSMSDFDNPIIYSDSAVVVNHINSKWVCRSPHLLPLYFTVKEIQKEFSFNLVQVNRNKVFLPDELCNQFLDYIQEEKRKLLSNPTSIESSEN